MMQPPPQQQQQQQPGMVVGIHSHHPGDAAQPPVSMLLQAQHQHHHQQHQLMDEGNMGMPEDDEEDEEEEDDPAELAAAAQSSAGGGGGGGGGAGGGPGVVDSSNNAMMEQSVAGMLGGHVAEATRRQQQQQQQQQQQNQRGRSLSGGSQSPGGLQMPVLPVPCCRVDGCGEDLSTAGDYHRRHKVCKMHATSPKVINHGQEQRFCQQCSRFHSLAEFDEGKRSCRKRLAGHNERRRRHQPDALAITSGESSPLPQGRESSKKQRGRGAGGNGSSTGTSGGGGGGGGSRRGRSTLGFGTRAGVSEEAVLQEMQSLSKRARTMKSGDEYGSMFSDAFPERRGESMKGKERAMRLQVAEMMDKRVGEYREIDELDIDIADAEQVREGLDLGEGVIVPPLPYKRDGKLSLLRSPQEGGVINPTELQIDVLRRPKEELDKRAWQRDEKETLIHCFWDCPKVQPVWRWAARQLTKLKGSKVRLEMQHAVFGVKVESLTTSDITSVWKLLRGIVVWQIWIARKGKVSSGTQWTSNKVIRASWLDLMMYAYQDWLEVSKKKEAGKTEDALELRTKFDNKWLVNQFAGKRAEWIIVWKEADDVLLD